MIDEGKSTKNGHRWESKGKRRKSMAQEIVTFKIAPTCLFFILFLIIFELFSLGSENTFKVKEKVNWRLELLLLFPMKNFWSVNSWGFMWVFGQLTPRDEMLDVDFPEQETLFHWLSLVLQSLGLAPKGPWEKISQRSLREDAPSVNKFFISSQS